MKIATFAGPISTLFCARRLVVAEIYALLNLFLKKSLNHRSFGGILPKVKLDKAINLQSF
jgi:hypothetical protein